MSQLMVVDDNEEQVEATSLVLKSAGYDVYGTSDIPKAIETFRELAPDVCVLDYQMPQMLGSDLAQVFRGIDPHIEIIFLTGEEEIRIAIELMKSGAIDYLIKPVSAHYLRRSVAKAIDHRSLIVENLAYKNHLETMVAQQTAALNASLVRMERLSTATLDTLGLALDFRDQSTSGHSRRVADNTVAIAKELGVSGDALLNIEQGAFLHDIGKLKIPDGILLKPATLTETEWTTMRRHPQYGMEFLSKIDFLAEAAQLVFTHHEKFDGSGYPQGLRGEAIPIGARIFNIIDAIDAMTYARPYNKPISLEEALEEVARCSGRHFDPEIAQVIIKRARSDRRAAAPGS